MKKLKLFVLTGFLLSTACAFAACQKEQIDRPSGFFVDEENILTWIDLDEAKTYSISIIDKETGKEITATSRKASYSLDELEEGTYDIRVKAVANGLDFEDSAWSKAFVFEKEYDPGCVFKLVNNVEYHITKVGTASGTVVIEDVYKDKPVTAIADGAFKNSSRIEKVVIKGSNVKSIGKSAFYNCKNLKEVEIADSVSTIGASAFQSCRSLKSIKLPAELNAVLESTFYYCRGLESVQFGNKVTSIGDSAFSNCSSLKEVTIPDSVVSLGEYAFSGNTVLEKATIGKGMRTIGPNAFQLCETLQTLTFADGCELQSISEFAFSDAKTLKKVEIPVLLENIGDSAFYNCLALEEINIPDTVTHVGQAAFMYTKMYEDRKNDPLIYVDKWIIGCSETVLENVTKIEARKLLDEKGEVLANMEAGVVGIADYAFSGAKKLLQAHFSINLKVIGNFAFAACENLWKLTSEENIDTKKGGLTTIGAGAFAYCVNLRNVQFVEGIVTIGANAFYSCVNLVNNAYADRPLIPNSVRAIGANAFKDTGLWKLPDDSGVVYAGNWVVGVNNLSAASITLKEGTVGIAEYAFFDCQGLKNIENLSSARYICRAAFYACGSLQSAVLGMNLKEVADYAFYGCQALMYVDIPNPDFFKIGRSAFYGCVSLTEFSLAENTVTEIGPYAFFGCQRLINFDAGVDLETIGDYAFYKCISLPEIVLPQTVKTVGEYAFSHCVSLKSITLSNAMTEIKDRTFSYCEALESIVIPDSVTKIGAYAFYKNSGLKKIDLGVGVQSIGEYAFFEAIALEVLELPANIQEVGRYAFKGSAALQSLVLTPDIEVIGEHAFYGCNLMTIYSDASAKVEGWDVRWNSGYRPIVYGCTLSEDKTYVVSFTYTAAAIDNVMKREITAPVREGYTFVGWSTQAEGGETFTDLTQAQEGVTLYAIWTKTPSEEPVPEVSETNVEE